MRSTHLLCAAWLSPAGVGAFIGAARRGPPGGALAATRAIGPAPVAKAVAPKKAAATKAVPKKAAPKAAAKDDPFAALSAKLAGAGSLPKTAKPKAAAVAKKPAVKAAAKKPAVKAAPKKKPVVKAAAKPKRQPAVKAKPKPRVVARKKPANINIANKLAKKSNKFDGNIANNLIKTKRKKKILTPVALAQLPAKKKPKAAAEEVLNPITFGLRVVQSKEGQEAAGALIGGGLKLVAATLDEGKTAKVSVPRGLNPKTGEIMTEAVRVGPKELLDGGLVAGGAALAAAGSAYNKAYRGYAAPRNGARKVKATIRPAEAGVLNPLTFGLKVAQSKEARAALPGLVDGGIKLVQATLKEGQKVKVSVPRRVDKRNGEVFTKPVRVGPGELLQAGLFAGGEILDAGKSVYERLYVTGGDFGGEEAEKAAAPAKSPLVKTIKKNVDPKTRRTLSGEKETYVVNIGGTKVRVVRDAGRIL